MGVSSYSLFSCYLRGCGADIRNGTGGIEQSGQKAIDLGATALKAGILHIDTAQYYGTEAETWGAIEKAGMKRGDVWVTDKSKSSSFRRDNADDQSPVVSLIPNLKPSEH
jgi:diketogulonate reductase-like aldo/keto reductase